MSNFLAKIKLPNLKLSITAFNFLVAVWIGIFLNFTFLAQINALTPYRGLKAYLFVFATACVLVALYNLIFQIINWKWTVKLFSIILIFIGGLSAYFVGSLGVIITPEQIQNSMQTDSKEAIDLLSMRFIIWALLFVLLPSLVLYWIKIKPEPLTKILLKKSSVPWLLCWLFSGCCLCFTSIMLQYFVRIAVSKA